jgi:4-hydroxybenzoate polyprenyltransferase
VLPANLLSIRFLGDYFVTMRPYLLFVSGITGIAGMSLAPDIPILRGSILALVFFSSYGFGQALTDCFQLDTDSISAPYRPLVQGTVKLRDVLAVSLLGLLLCGLIVTLYNPVNILPASLTVVGLATYTFFKRRWWGGPFYNSWIVAMVAIIGYLAATGPTQVITLASASFIGLLVAVFFGYANFVLTGYYKDVRADRATGYRTLPVHFGLKLSSLVSDLFALAMLAGCAITVSAVIGNGHTGTSAWTAALLLTGGCTATVVAQLRLHTVTDDTEAHRAVEPVVHAYILLLSGIAALNKPVWTISLILFYGAFLVTMKLRPIEQQI